MKEQVKAIHYGIYNTCRNKPKPGRENCPYIIEDFYNFYDIVYHLKVDYEKLKCYKVTLMQALIQRRVTGKRQKGCKTFIILFKRRVEKEEKENKEDVK